MMKTSLKVALSAAAAASLLIAGGAAHASKEIATPGVQNQINKVVASVKGLGKPTFGGGGGNGISYHNGPVMVSGITVYPIWYGNISASTKSVISGFLANVGGSPYFNINTTYYNASNQKVQNTATSLKLSTSSYSDTSYALGTNLSDANIQSLVATAINGGSVPNDVNGFYLVITAPDVSESSGFLTQYCGWHTYSTIGNTPIKYSFVGDPTAGMTACASKLNYTSSPNGNPAADAMVSVVAHELEEAATDPQISAWYDGSRAENADKCAWKFGTTKTATNGSSYNVVVGTNQYLIQQNWVNASGGYCALSY